jgi:hypothetical protein
LLSHLSSPSVVFLAYFSVYSRGLGPNTTPSLNVKKQLVYTNEHKLTQYESGMGRKIGRVAKVYKTDEVSDNPTRGGVEMS